MDTHKPAHKADPKLANAWKGKAGRAYLKGLPSGYGRGVRAHFRKIKASKRF